MTTQAELYAFLEANGIPYQRFDHKAVFTTKESSTLDPMPGADTKNLFLRDEKERRHFLVTLPHEKSADLKALKKLLDVSKLSFGSEERLLKHLGVTPGSATILGALCDIEHAVEFILDASFEKADALQCHPLTNTGTLVIPRGDLLRFLRLTGHEPRFLDVPSRSA